MKNAEMYEMYKNGSTYQEIGDALGISRQAVHQRMIYYKRKVMGIRGHGFNINDIVYQGIYDWFNEHYDESIYSLLVKVYGRNSSSAGSYVKFREFIIGEHDTHFKIKTIKRLCEVIGKPFEEVFKRRDVI